MPSAPDFPSFSFNPNIPTDSYTPSSLPQSDTQQNTHYFSDSYRPLDYPNERTILQTPQSFPMTSDQNSIREMPFNPYTEPQQFFPSNQQQQQSLIQIQQTTQLPINQTTPQEPLLSLFPTNQDYLLQPTQPPNFLSPSSENLQFFPQQSLSIFPDPSQGGSKTQLFPNL